MFKFINLSGVSACDADECAYNSNHACHAIAITVGDGDTPMCDTYFRSGQHSGVKGSAGVGACKVAACQHNRDFECGAGRIQVGSQGNKISCITFAHT